MHILESHASYDNLKIDLPQIYEKYYPVNAERYITIDTSSAKNQENYDFWKIAMDMAKTFLISKNISIIQIGEKEDLALGDVEDLLGKLDVNQKAYVLKNSLLHIGNNNISAHIASFLNVKCLTLFNNDFIDQSKPYWSKDSFFVGLTPERDTLPSQISNEKEINKICPEDISEKIINLLGGNFKKDFKTLKIGNLFMKRKIESSMSSLIPNIQNYGIESLICRMDYEFNEKVLVNQLQLCKCSIVTTKPINLKILKLFRHNILEILYVIEEDNDSSFVESVNKMGIKIGLNTYLSEKEINKYKINYLDLPQNINIVKTKALKDINKESLDKVFYKSNKFILHDGKIYPSKSALNRNQSCENFNPPFFPTYNEDDFWREIDYLYLVEKKD